MEDQGTPGAGSGAASSDVRRSVDVAAPPDEVWALVSDLPAMGGFSPENRGGRWVSGEGPAVGAVSVGSNGAGRRRWSTRCTVVRCEPGRLVSGVSDRSAFTAASIEATLQAVKETAERARTV